MNSARFDAFPFILSPKMLPLLVAVIVGGPPPSRPIIGGYGKYKYEYIPTLLEFPAGAEVQHVHGLEVDKQGKS